MGFEKWVFPRQAESSALPPCWAGTSLPEEEVGEDLVGVPQQPATFFCLWPGCGGHLSALGRRAGFPRPTPLGSVSNSLAAGDHSYSSSLVVKADRLPLFH